METLRSLFRYLRPLLVRSSRRAEHVRLGFLVMLGIALLAAACNPSQSVPSEAGGDNDVSPATQPEAAVGSSRDSLTVNVFQAPPHLDLTRPTALVQPLMLLYNVYEPLVGLDEDLEPQPLLAESWDVSDDGTEYTFHLRDATFHDGSEFTADDVVFTFEHNMQDDAAPAFITQAYQLVDTVEKVDDQTVRVTLTRPSNLFLSASKGIAGAAGVIIPGGAESEQLQNEPVGTGPFQVGNYAPERSLTVERFDDYWGESPALRQVDFTFVGDPNSAVNTLLAGDVEAIATLLAPERASELENDPRFNTVSVSGGPVWHLIMNMENETLADERVRQAIVHSIDQQGFIDAVQFGFGDAVCGWIPVTHPSFTNTCAYEHDQARARQLLAEAGAEGASFTIKATQAVESAAQLAAAQLREVGLDVTVERRDDAAYFEEFFAGNFELTVIGFSEDAFYDIADCPPPYVNGYCNEDVRQLVEEGDAADLQEAFRLWGEANDIVTGDAISAELFNQSLPMVLPAELEGYSEHRVAGEFDLRGLRFSASAE